jgi:squalene synthase HpnC
VTTRSLLYTRHGVAPVPGPGPSPAAPAGLPEGEEILGRAGGENFRVASRLLPRATRRHLLAFYGFARLVDQIGDDYQGDRAAALDWVTTQLDAALADPDRPGLHPLVAGAAASVLGLGADPKALADLVTANRQDQVVTRYPTYEALAGYCRLSANPVGRLVLAAFMATTPERQEYSDRICTGLQLAEHWQDVAEDAAAGRIYLPTEDMARFGVDPSDLTSRPPASGALRALMAFEVARARRVLDEGAPLINSLRGRPRWAIAGFWAGGHAALDAVARRRFDPLYGAPSPAPWRVAVRLATALREPA